jgi:hypothetical protein
MLRWTCGHIRKDRIRNEVIRARLGVAAVEEALVQHRLRWFGHIQRRPPEASVNSRILRGGKNAKRQGATKAAVKRYLKDWNVPIDLTLDRIA